MESIPKGILEALKKDELVLFVGSGTSLCLDKPNWKDLVLEIIEKVIEVDDKMQFLKVAVENGGMGLLDVLTQLEKNGHEKIIREYINQRFRIDSLADLKLQKSILNLSSKIITTNYDHAIEKSKKEDIEIITYGNKFGLSTLSKKDKYIIKLHGDINDASSCILFESDYEKLYNKQNENNALFHRQFNNLLLNKTVLFIGFSLNDPYINKIIDELYKITQGYLNKHFLITTDKNFKHNCVEPVFIDDYNEGLNSLIIELNDRKEIKISEPQNSSKTTVDVIDKNITQSNINVNVNLFCSTPIDKDYSNNFEYLSKPFLKYNVTLKHSILNIRSLRELEGGYAFIISKTQKSNIIIEDEYLKSRQISHDEFVDNISDDISGVFIFTNEIPKIQNAGNIPICYIIEDKASKIKSLIESICFKLFVKKNLEFTETGEILNKENFKLINVEKGKANKINPNLNVSKYLDQKLLTHFIGRKTDVENIIRKIIDLEYESKLLTIKGSGGIGKTTIIIKAAIELAHRETYNSIQFVSCQAINSYENFAYQVSDCLGIDSAEDIYKELPLKINEKSTILILDNFETLLNLPEKKQILELVSFLCDYVLIVNTTRQLLDLEFEEIYELRNLTTSEGLELFKIFYKKKLSDTEEKILRNEIVDKLLNNNPLAIKIISKGTIQSKPIESLKEELEENIFNNENIDRIFDNPEDINIEKSHSLYYSIKYSYDKLNTKEKLAFELLSLFPDGIHIDNLKKFSKENKKQNEITDREIKSLNDKSLLENRGGFVKLQSIVNRFSSYQFSLLDENIQADYFNLCFDYNKFFIGFLQDERYFKNSHSLSIMNDNINNYTKCLDFIDKVDAESFVKLDYIDSVTMYFRHINQDKEMLKKLEKVESLFKDNDSEKKLLKLIKLQLIYWCSDFEFASNSARELISQDFIKSIDLKNDVEGLIFSKIQTILTCEGESFEYVKELLEKWHIKAKSTFSELFKIGFIEIAEDLIQYEIEHEFFEYEVKLANNSLKEGEIEKYISSLFKKEHLEIIQSNYTKTKLVGENDIDTSLLVVSNPYTKGITDLINALNTNVNDEKEKFFLNAINHLEYNKYYLTEAVYLYSLHLNKIGATSRFEKYFKLGKKLSDKYNFFFLDFQFDKIKDSSLSYNESVIFEKRPDLDEDLFYSFIQQHTNVLKKRYKSSK